MNPSGYDVIYHPKPFTQIIPQPMKQHDEINNPAHYTQGTKIEPINVIEDWQLGFHLGNTVKYIRRAGHKESQLKDLKKARWYLDRFISTLESSANEKKESS